MRKFLLVFLLFPVVLLAQELDTLSTDSVTLEEVVKEPPAHLIGGYLLASFRPSPGPDTFGSVGVAGVGGRYDRYEAEILYSYFLGSYAQQLIFPNIFDLRFASLGAQFSYRLFDMGRWKVAPFLGVHHGDMLWERSETGEDFFRETFTVVQLGGKAEFQIHRFIKPEVSIGYQKMSDFSLPSLNDGNFTGLFAAFTVKVGYFNQ